jgi:hypothetical protein
VIPVRTPSAGCPQSSCSDSQFERRRQEEGRTAPVSEAQGEAQSQAYTGEVALAAPDADCARNVQEEDLLKICSEAAAAMGAAYCTCTHQGAPLGGSTGRAAEDPASMGKVEGEMAHQGPLQALASASSICIHLYTKFVQMKHLLGWGGGVN